jgi:hypothetical protein
MVEPCCRRLQTVEYLPTTTKEAKPMIYEDGMSIDFDEKTKVITVKFRGGTHQWKDVVDRPEAIKRGEDLCKFLAINRPKVA